jgi:hypothetical protein
MKTFLCAVTILGWGFFAHGSTVFYFTSSPTSWIGQGLTWTITPATGYRFDVELPGNDLDVFIGTTNLSDWWSLDFQAPNGAELADGLYTNVQVYPFQQSGHPGLAFKGDSRANASVTGWFQVLDYSEINGVVVSAAVDFVQYDDGALAEWNFGSFRYNLDIPLTIVPEPTSMVLLGSSLFLWRARRASLGRVNLNH